MSWGMASCSTISRARRSVSDSEACRRFLRAATSSSALYFSFFIDNEASNHWSSRQSCFSKDFLRCSSSSRVRALASVTAAWSRQTMSSAATASELIVPGFLSFLTSNQSPSRSNIISNQSFSNNPDHVKDSHWPFRPLHPSRPVLTYYRFSLTPNQNRPTPI